jgi:hydrogenase maturation protease
MGVRRQGLTAKILIAGVGYRNLCDMSLGPVLVDRLGQDAWPHGVEVEDLSYGPIGVMHSLDERGPYERIIFIAGVRRNRQPGGIYVYRWGHQLPPAEEVQARVAEAITGVISLDNLLIIATYFGKLPRDVIVIEVEAADEGWGEGFTPDVEAVIPQVIEKVRYHLTSSGKFQLWEQAAQPKLASHNLLLGQMTSLSPARDASRGRTLDDGENLDRGLWECASQR